MGRGEKIESAAVEEDSGAVVEGVTEATGRPRKFFSVKVADDFF
jgi:hypothetical protein